MIVKTKICGLQNKDEIEAAQDNGASFLGFIFAETSPRYIAPAKTTELRKYIKQPKVAVTVNASDALLAEIMQTLVPEFIQLHGDETLERAKEIRDKYEVKIIRAFTPDKVVPHPAYAYLLIDSGAGGTGKQFDYTNFVAPKQPWFLSGGLTAENVKDAIARTGAKLVDVSSGVERQRGVKDLDMMKNFLKATHVL